MSDLRTKTLRIASELPVGDPTRRKLLASLSKTMVVVSSVQIPKHFKSRNELRRFLSQQLPGYKFRTKIVTFSHGSAMYITATAPDGYKFGGNVVHRSVVDAYPEYFDLLRSWPDRPAPTIEDQGETFKVLW